MLRDKWDTIKHIIGLEARCFFLDLLCDSQVGCSRRALAMLTLGGFRQVRHKMKIRVYIICLLILLLFSGHPGLAQNPRDLTHYDDGGAFDFGWAGRPDADAKMRPKLRDFLWEHWTQKHLAHVVVTFYTIEGDPTTYNLFVEPDRDRRWRVVAEHERECCWYYAMEKPRRKRKREKGAVIYDVVERVQTSGGGQAPLSHTPEGNRREADSYILRLRQIVDGNKLGGELIF